jgi:2-polyprenyl-6-methoxyphenol hydroxylase-like FAD-dependent oxidoreductase
MAYDYDVITVGGGIGGSSLAKMLAEKGLRVLVLERERVFQDRVRGEYMHPWGVTEMKTLGLYELLKQACAHEVRFRISQIFGAPPASPRDMVLTSPHQVGSLHFYHPEMQEALLTAAATAGAFVHRRATVIEALPGPNPSVRVQEGNEEHLYRSRLVVGADGRTSACRKWGNFSVHRDPQRMIITGVLVTGFSAPDNSLYVFPNPLRSEYAFQVPLGDTRFRCYAGFYRQEGRQRLNGSKAMPDFVKVSISAGTPREWFTNAELAGPLASFDCAEMWVEHPYQAGIVLVGDAAAISDPSFGCGLSLTARDARVLGQILLAETNWDSAADAYADEHDRYFSSLHRLLAWQTELLYEPGREAAERRARAFARIAEDPRRAPDIAGLGPEAPSNDAAYQNLFGEPAISK